MVKHSQTQALQMFIEELSGNQKIQDSCDYFLRGIFIKQYKNEH